MSTTDCRSDEGKACGLVDTILNAAHVLIDRNLDHPAVCEALQDLASDHELRSLLGHFLSNDRDPVPLLTDSMRDHLGRVVRLAWIRWAKMQPDPKSSWLVPYDELSEPEKEADRQIGQAVIEDINAVRLAFAEKSFVKALTPDEERRLRNLQIAYFAMLDDRPIDIPSYTVVDESKRVRAGYEAYRGVIGKPNLVPWDRVSPSIQSAWVAAYRAMTSSPSLEE